MIKFVFISITLHLLCLGFFIERFSQEKKPQSFSSTIIDLNTVINNKNSAKIISKNSIQNSQSLKPSNNSRKVVTLGDLANQDKNQNESQNISADGIVNSKNKEVTIIKSIEPEYPLLARKNGQEGEVKVDVEIDENGKIISKKIIQSSKYKLLDNSVLNSLDQFEFSPAKNNYKTVIAKITINYLFKLN